MKAELAVAQANVRQFAAELRRAAVEQTKTGDMAPVRAAAAAYDVAAANVGRLRTAIREAGDAHRDLLGPLQAARAALGNLYGQARELVGAFKEMGDRVIPHWREILAISIAAAGIEFAHLVTHAAAAVRSTENMAKSLGFTTGEFEAASLVGAQFGVGQDELSRALARSARSLGALREEGLKLGGDLPGSQVTALRGGVQSLSDAASVARGNVRELNESIFGAIGVLRGGARSPIDLSKAFLDIANNPALSAADKQIEVGKRIDAIKDSTIKAEVAMRQYGRSWVLALPAILGMASGLKTAETEIEHSGLALQDYEKANARSFNAAAAEFGFYFGRVKEIVFGALGQAAIPILKDLTETFKSNASEIRRWANDAGKSLGDVARDFITLARGGSGAELKTDFARSLLTVVTTVRGAIIGLKDAFRGIMTVLDGIAGVINDIFGTRLTGGMLAAVIAVGYLAGGFGVLAAAIGLARVAALFFLTNPIGAAIGAIGIIALTVYQNWEKIGPLVQKAWGLFQAFGAWVREQLAQAFSDTWDAIKSGFDSLVAWFGDRITDLENLIDAVWKKFKAVADAIKSLPGGSLSSPVGAPVDVSGSAAALPYASGGHIRGSGTGTSDSILARVSNGEFVQSARAVSHYGVGFMQAVNGMRLPRFAFGGLVDAIGSAMMPHPPMAFASGGLVSGGGGTPVHIHLDGQSYAMSADSDVVNQLGRAARTRQLLSTGRKPGWRGS